MSEVNESHPWARDFTRLHDDDVIKTGDWKYQLSEFGKGAAEMSVEFCKGVRDVVRQSKLLSDDSVIMKNLRSPFVKKVSKKLSFLNRYLPEDRNPVHSWTVILFVSFFALSALIVNTNPAAIPLVKKMKTHPTSATLIMLPDGRRLAYQEHGVPADQARHSMIVPHSFLSSRLAGIPGLKGSLMQEFGVRLVTYDLPGFGESDPHPKRDLESSAMDILHLSYAVNVTDKFWVVGYSDGSMHAWAALRYIPDRLEGAIMVAPMVNPYEPRLSKEEKRTIWGTWTARKRIMFVLARKFPKLLAYFYRRSFLSGNHGEMDMWLSLSLGKKDRALMKNQIFEEFWQRDVEESVRQKSVKPFVQEAALLVSDWGFNIADLKVHHIHKVPGFLVWLKSLYSSAEEKMNGFPGPIHIWQGAEDKVVPPSMSNFVSRVLPDVMLHKLPYEGHFTYFYFCDECHRQMFTVVLGNPQGPLSPKVDPISTEDDEENIQEIFSDTETDKENVSNCLA